MNDNEGVCPQVIFTLAPVNLEIEDVIIDVIK